MGENRVMVPSLVFQIMFAPINMVMTEESRSIGEFYIHVCSIIGGIFVIFGLVNSFMLKIFK